ncbi:SDR family NAD(P)-dependent oxidoreductase [Angustibacter luteus]|uniref:SDR family NAD(P)-dependent oxidoreductase n=1 Tax=Angustibacter luteus TaxID=658456 RepID=A0ABW1JIP6_9ACTN
MKPFENVVAVVTGGASGIGAATTTLLLAQGARVAVLDRSVETVPDGSWGVVCDITDTGQVDAAIAAVVERFGQIDVLVNNAGIGAAGDVAANDDDEWHRVLDVNVVGLARVSRAALPHLRASSSAAIVNTCSVVAAIGVPNRALYAASKGAVAALTLAMAADHVREGIRVNAVVPGTADTPWVERLLQAADDPEATGRGLRARQPMGRLVSADEVAHAIVYLASPAAASTTGTLLAVDGGMTGVQVQ